jgi:hypothetical protein
MRPFFQICITTKSKFYINLVMRSQKLKESLKEILMSAGT